MPGPYGLDARPVFPPARLADPDGLIAVGGDLSVPRLLAAYRAGIFPWYNDGDPILWWSPDPRGLFLPGDPRVHRSMRPLLNHGRFRVTANAAFGRVIRACRRTPRPGQSGTWLTPEMVTAYEALHAAGHAHSVEAWDGEVLAGGLYGVALGRAFCGESMFSARRDASKYAFLALATRLFGLGYRFIDAQMPNPHLERLGLRAVPRETFLRLLHAAQAEAPPPGAWPGPGGGQWFAEGQNPWPAGVSER